MLALGYLEACKCTYVSLPVFKVVGSQNNLEIDFRRKYIFLHMVIVETALSTEMCLLLTLLLGQGQYELMKIVKNRHFYQ